MARSPLLPRRHLSILPEIAPRSVRLARRVGSRNRGRGRMPPPHDEAVIDIWGQTRREWDAGR